MKILIVSFDKNLTKQLKKVLEDHEVIDVRNGEEALNLTSQDFDVIIYDAISGAISEEDINNMYEQRFKDAKFIVLVDDLFPVNEKNLKPDKKLLITREHAVNKILDAIEKPLEESAEMLLPLLPELEIERHTLIEEGPSPLQEQWLNQERTIAPKRRISIVSFDSTLIDSITSLLPKDLEVYPVRSFRNLEEVLKDQDLVVFDAISGLTAKRRLMELSKDPNLSSKPFIILVDELFSIDVEDIPLARKYAVLRADSPEKISQKIMEVLTSDLGPVLKEEEPEPLERIWESFETLKVEESVSSVEENLEETIPPWEKEEIQLEEIPSALEGYEPVSSVQNQAIIPIEGKKIEETTYRADIGPIDEIVKSALREKISAESLEVAIKEEVRRTIESALQENILREAIRQAVEEKLTELIKSVPLEAIIKEVTYKVLQERLRELIT